MTPLDPAALLRHRPPAVFVGPVRTASAERLVCASNGAGPWTWPQLLEGGAQTAGLLVGTQPGGLSNRAVVAEYRSVRVRTATHVGPVEFTATLDRHMLRFWRCRIAVHASDGTPLVTGLVTLAPPGATQA